MEIESYWYKTFDYSVYESDIFFADLWACWVVYSKKYLQGLEKNKNALPNPNNQPIVDLGCGFGYTTKRLEEIFPGAPVIGTNIEFSEQTKICKKLGVRVVGDIEQLPLNVHLVFASEYYEHIEKPIDQLEKLLIQCNPRFLIIANSFGAEAIGHFPIYKHRNIEIKNKDMGRYFNKHLRLCGYRQMNIKNWNNRPTYWEKIKP